MPKKIQAQLTLAIVPSQRLKYGLVVVHILAVIACLINALPLVVKTGLALAVAGYYLFISKRLAHECWTIRHSDFFGWQILVNGQFEAIKILDSTVLTPFAIFLHFRYNSAKKGYLALFNDALTNDDFRQCVVRLKTTRTK
jgi:hypothetical protein